MSDRAVPDSNWTMRPSILQSVSAMTSEASESLLYMNDTPVSLLDRVRRGRGEESWERLEALYAPLLRRWIGRYSLQDSDADDLVQEVLMTLSRELPEFDHSGRPGAFRKWLRGILVHRLQHFWRTKQRRPVATGTSSVQEQLAQLQDDTSQVSRMWDEEHDQHVLSGLLETVRPQFEARTWEAFRRQAFRGEPGRAVADELGMTLKAVQLAKARVLRILRAEAAGLIDSA